MSNRGRIRKKTKTTTKKRRTSIGRAAGPGKPVGQHFGHDSQDLISDLEVVGEGKGRFYDQIDTYPMTLVS